MKEPSAVDGEAPPRRSTGRAYSVLHWSLVVGNAAALFSLVKILRDGREDIGARLVTCWAVLVVPAISVFFLWVRPPREVVGAVFHRWALKMTALCWSIVIYLVLGGAAPWPSDALSPYAYASGDRLYVRDVRGGSWQAISPELGAEVAERLHAAHRVWMDGAAPRYEGEYRRSGQALVGFKISRSHTFIIDGRYYASGGLTVVIIEQLGDEGHLPQGQRAPVRSE